MALMTKKRGKTLIIQNLQGIGDTLWFVRHYRAIARSTERGTVTLMTRPRSLADQILCYVPFIEEVMWLHVKPGVHDGLYGTISLANLIKEKGFDHVWILHSRSIRYAAACFLAGVAHRFGPGIGLQRFLLNEPPFLEGLEQREHPILRATKLLEKHGLFLDKDTVPLNLGEAEKKWAHHFLKEFPLPWIGFGIASSEPHKKWPSSNYRALAQKLWGSGKEGTFFILGGPLEAEEGQALQQSLVAEGIRAQAMTHLPIGSSLALIQRLSFMVGNDTGILHATPMVGTRGLVLLGKAQVPIHHFAEVEGLHLNLNETVASKPNDIGLLSPDRVMEKLKTLGWI